MAKATYYVDNTLNVFQLLVAIWHIAKLTPLATLFLSFCGYLLSYLGINYQDYAKVRRWQKNQGFVMDAKEFSVLVEEFVPFEIVSPKECEISLLNGYECSFEFQRPDVIVFKFQGRIIKYNVTNPDYYWKRLCVLGKRPYIVKEKETFYGDLDCARLMDPLEIVDEILLYNKSVCKFVPGRKVILRRIRSEEKLLNFVNLASLYSDSFNVYLRLGLSFGSIVLDLFTSLRATVFDLFTAGLIACCVAFGDRLRSKKSRRFFYGMGTYVEGLKPSNDVSMKKIDERIDPILLVSGNLRYENLLQDPSFVPEIESRLLWSSESNKFIMDEGEALAHWITTLQGNQLTYEEFARQYYDATNTSLVRAMRLTQCPNVVSVNGNEVHCLRIADSLFHHASNEHAKIRFLKIPGKVQII